MIKKKEDSPERESSFLLSKFEGEEVSNHNEASSKDQADRRIRYLVTALICTSFLCHVSNL